MDALQPFSRKLQSRYGRKVFRLPLRGYDFFNLCLRRTELFAVLGDEVFRKGQDLHGTSIIRGFPKSKDIVSLLQHKCAFFFVILCQSLDREGKSDFFHLAGGQFFCLCKCHQALVLSPCLSEGNGCIEFGYLSAGNRAGVLHFGPYFKVCIILVKRLERKRKCRVGKPVSEGETGLFAEGIKEPVADIDAFVIFLHELIFSEIGIGRIRRDISKVVGPAGGQTAGEVGLSGKAVSNGVPSLFPSLHEVDQGVHIKFIEEGYIDDPAGIDDNNQLFVLGPDRPQVLDLHVVETVVSLLVLPVCAFPCLAGKDIDCRSDAGFPVRLIILCLHWDAGRMPELPGHAEHLVKARNAFDLLLDSLPVGFIGIRIELVKAVQPVRGRNCVARIQKAFRNAHTVPLPDCSGPGPAFDRHPGPGPVEGQSLLFQWQRAVILNKHEALCCCLPGQGPVFKFHF